MLKEKRPFLLLKMDSGIPTPPTEEINMKNNTSTQAIPRRSTISSTKPVKPLHRVTKRSATHLTHTPIHDHTPPSPPIIDTRHKRVWKACERCRMKKTKCDGEFPCKRCKDDGLVCTAGTRKKTEYKQIPRGYAEVLENTQFALIATVHKLYAMVRNGQVWDLGEPELNDRGQPIIHNIATKLGCIRPNADADLPAHTVFPEDEASLAQLAAELDSQLPDGGQNVQGVKIKCEIDTNCAQMEPCNTPGTEQSDYDAECGKALMNGHSHAQRRQQVPTLSPDSFGSYSDFEPTPMQTEVNPPVNLFPIQSPATAPLQTNLPFTAWPMARAPMIPSQYIDQLDHQGHDYLFSQGLVESEFGTIKPHRIDIPNPEVIVGVGDPMIAYSNYGHNMDPMSAV